MRLGSFLHLPGSFDSCLEADAGSFRGKHCLLSIVSSGSTQRTEATAAHLPASVAAEAVRWRRMLQEAGMTGINILAEIDKILQLTWKFETIEEILQ